MRYLLVLVLFLSPLSAQSLQDLNLKATWDDFYNIGAEGAWGHPGTRPEIRLSYHRFVMVPVERARAVGIVAALGWDSDSRIHVVNCGFWFLEVLEELGITDTSCSTTSTYIQNNKDQNENTDIRNKVLGVGLSTTTGDGLQLFNVLGRNSLPRSDRRADMLDEDLRTRASRDRVKARTGNNTEIFVYDGYINGFTDAEALVYHDDLKRQTGVRRIVYESYEAFLNGHTLAEWKALIPDAGFIEGVSHVFLP